MSERATKAEIAVRGLARLMRRTGSGAATATEHARGRARLLATLESEERAPRARDWWVGAALGGALAVVVLLLAPLFERAPTPLLAFAIEGAPAGQSYVQAGPGGATARFSEGTVVSFAAGARGRVVGVTTRGARISVEKGAAHFEVVHRPDAEWLAEAGPFVITVTGTAFDLDWNGAELEVVMRSGSVIIRGPAAPGGVALRVGQRLVADEGRVEVSRFGDAGAVTSAAPSASAEAPSLASAPIPPRTATIPPPLPWRARVASGDFAGVIAEAEARGLDASIDGSSLADLAALADAARYAGRADLAQRALIAERARFAGSSEARSAAFLLGRLTETSSPAAAVAWYDLYLGEAPGGSLAAEALGRKMLAVKASSGRDAARPIAEQYRSRFPDGAFAAAAREVLRDP